MRLMPAVLAVAWLVPGLAVARPPTGLVDMSADSERFLRAAVEAVATDAPAVLAAELLPSGEVLLTSRAPGRALLFLVAADRLDVLRVRVRESGGKHQEKVATEAQRAAVRKDCRGFKEDRERGERTLAVRVTTGACRRALLDLLETDDYPARGLEVGFEVEPLQEQLAAIQAAMRGRGLERAYEVAYSGTTLRIKGKGTAAQKLELLQVAYEQTVGRLLFDDQTEVVPEEKATAAPDAGAVAGPDAGL